MFILIFLLFCGFSHGEDIKLDNINGVYAVKEAHHYANKTSITWGKNGLKDWSVTIMFDENAATYNSSTTCDDPAWYGDWNKLWGKARCGYYHDHHQDSDRFVWRRCSDSTCSIYKNDNIAGVQIGGYSYDDGIAPYKEPGTSMGLLQPFDTLVNINTYYTLNMVMDEEGLTTYNLYTTDMKLLETHVVQHTQLCSDNYYMGTVNGLYFGGDCKAPVDIVVQYKSE